MLQSKDTEWLIGYKNKTHLYAAYKRLTLELKIHRLKVRQWEKVFLENGKEKKTGVEILVSEKIDCKTKTVVRDKERHYIMIKGSIQEEEKTTTEWEKISANLIRD